MKQKIYKVEIVDNANIRPSDIHGSLDDLFMILFNYPNIKGGSY